MTFEPTSTMVSRVTTLAFNAAMASTKREERYFMKASEAYENFVEKGIDFVSDYMTRHPRALRGGLALLKDPMHLGAQMAFEDLSAA